jgi:hypothetical protein
MYIKIAVSLATCVQSLLKQPCKHMNLLLKKVTATTFRKYFVRRDNQGSSRSDYEDYCLLVCDTV